jgi:hypothetical protein
VLKQGSLLMAAMLGGGGRGCPGGTTMTGGSTGSAGGAGIALMILVSVQLSVAAEQLPASPACALTSKLDNKQHTDQSSPELQSLWPLPFSRAAPTP